MLKGEPFFAMARPSFFVEFLFQPFRITGRCLTFFPICRRSSAKTISGVRSKNPLPFFQLIPQRQCCKPINCCFIFRPQFGQTLLLAPMLLLVLQSNVFNEKLNVINLIILRSSIAQELLLLSQTWLDYKGFVLHCDSFLLQFWDRQILKYMFL